MERPMIIEEEESPLSSEEVHSTPPSQTSPVRSSPNSPPRKERSLQDIYESCYVAFSACEPQKFEESVKDEN